ncbi:MAG TPA: alpha/beta hydrolase [Caulobacteraceae bacterium]|jgi:triacylglycerol lipase|nr:alpha/beta hydrolase [Caulobacteraceae bacterium]
MRRRNALLTILAAAAVLAAAPALAQVPPNIAAQLKTLGRVVDPEHTGQIYAPYQRKPPYDGVKFVRDLKYGPDPKEDLDVATPAAAGRDRPVVLFVHGGAYVGGDKSRDAKGEPSPFYDNIMLWSVGKGMVGVNMNYPLAPGATYPKVQQDIAAVIVWIQKNIRRYGGDPNRVYIWGHSAGATHVATYIGHPEFYPKGGPGVRGAITTSATYDMTSTRPNVYFGPPETLTERSAKAGLLKTRVPLFIAAAELDPQGMVDSASQLNAALCAENRCPAWYGVLKDHSHMSESYHVNTADQSLAGPLWAFIKSH